MDCPVCLTHFLSTNNDIVILHDTHAVCKTCDENMKTHRIFECPLCRAPINEDLRQQINILVQHRRVISDAQLLSFNISQEFINLLHIENRIPFYYTGRFEGVDFLHQIQTEFDEWVTHYSPTS